MSENRTTTDADSPMPWKFTFDETTVTVWRNDQSDWYRPEDVGGTYSVYRDGTHHPVNAESPKAAAEAVLAE